MTVARSVARAVASPVARSVGAGIGGGVAPLSSARLFSSANSEYFSIASNSSLQTGDFNWTIAGWIKRASNSTMSAISKEGSGDYAYRIDHTSATMRFLSVGTSVDTFATKALAYDTAWHFVVAWFDSANNLSYLQLDDGTPSSDTNTVSSDISATPFMIGANGRLSDGAAENFWNGALAGFGLWKRLLTTEEKTHLFNSGQGVAYSSLGSSLKTDLQAYWNLDESSGDAIDSHGSNNLTDNNTVGSADGPGA